MLKIYMKDKKTPIVVETNLEWAIPYWEERKKLNPEIKWEINPPFQHRKGE